MTDKNATKRVDVTVKTDSHNHAGKPCKKGDVISVTPEQAERLKKAGVVE